METRRWTSCSTGCPVGSCPGGGWAERRSTELTTALDANDAFVIFRGGGNFTERCRLAVIERLRSRGLERMAWRSERMRHMPARVQLGAGGADRRTGGRRGVVAHAGLDHLHTAADVWRELLLDGHGAEALVAGAARRGAHEAPVKWLYQ